MSLEIRELHAHYGNSHVLQGVNLDVPPGSITGLLGRNGMGKTTLLRAITRRIPISSGTIRWHGVDLSDAPTHNIARAGVAHMPQGTRVFSSLTVEEHLRLARRLSEVRPETALGAEISLDRIYEWFPRLDERSRLRAGNLSGGERQALSLSRCLLTRPRLLLLDEPTEGLSPVMVQQFRSLLGELVNLGLTLLLIEQNLRFALGLSDLVHIFKNGRIERTYDSTTKPDEDVVRDAVMSA